MKTREIRDRVKSMGFERGMTYCVEAMNEQLLQTRRDITELANYFDKIVDTMDNVTNVTAYMRDTIEKSQLKEEEELGPNTNSLDKEDMN